MLDSAISEPGRQQLAQTFRLCDAARLDSKDAAQALQRDVMYSFQGFAQVSWLGTLNSTAWQAVRPVCRST
jgi:hypothetical protein